MKNHVATALALALVAGVTGLSAVPFAAAVDPDCNHDYDIATSPLLAQQRTLGAGETEVGRAVVEALGGNENLTVELTSNDDKLAFGIFEMDGSCTRSSNVAPSACESDVQLSTKGMATTDSATCTLVAPDSGATSFFVVFENIEVDGDQLTYRAWAS